jgi:O-antigen ligase
VLNFPRPDADRRWSLANAVYVSYTLFLAGFYFVPNAVDLYKFYIAAVFLPGLFLLPAALKLAWRSLIWRCLLAYLGYMLLSSLWSKDFSSAVLWRDARYLAYILSFILLALYFTQRNPRLLTATLHLTTLVVSVAAAVSIAIFEPAAQLPTLTSERLAGVGITENMNPSAFVYGFFAVVALDYVRQHWGENLAYVFATGFVVIVLFVILTQSNAGLLALTSASCLLFLLSSKRDPLEYSVGVFLCLVAALYLAWSLGLLTSAIDFGFSQRFSIWEHVLEKWRAAPIFGNGYQVALVLTAAGKESVVNYAHSLFLSTLRDGGMVGLLLLLPIYVLALRQGLKRALAGQSALYLSLFIFGLVCVLADVDQIVTRPRELWIILWLPLACLVADEVGAAEDGGDSPKNI